MTDTIDYTQMRKGSRPDGLRSIEICPKCGRKGLKSVYSKGGEAYNHKGKTQGFGVVVIDHCHINANEVKK